MNQNAIKSTNNNSNKSEPEPVVSESPFVEESNDSSLFLGIVNKRYLRTFYGMVHGIGSLLAIIFGNVVFANRVLLGASSSSDNKSAYDVLFHTCNFVGSAITALCFWNKVQSWQLSTTSMKEKGLTPKALQRLNQGRGVVSMILFSAFPLVCYILPKESFLESRLFSITFALALMAGSAFIYHVFRYYGKVVLWVVYGMTPMAVGLSIILCCSSGSSSDEGGSVAGTVAALNVEYPLVMDRFQKEASFVVSSTQVGFMLFYMYSRKLVTKSTVQSICKKYHVAMSLVYLLRIERDLWLQLGPATATATSGAMDSSLPWPMMLQPIILTVVMSAMLLPLLFKMGLAVGSKLVTTSIPLEFSTASLKERVQCESAQRL